jgi:hypothetical protein
MEYFSDKNRLVFFSDFHAHSGLKNVFVYGNHTNFARMIESKLFCTLLSNVSIEFTGKDCDFGAGHMSVKEKGDEYGKEACARVLGYHMV